MFKVILSQAKIKVTTYNQYMCLLVRWKYQSKGIAMYMHLLWKNSQPRATIIKMHRLWYLLKFFYRLIYNVLVINWLRYYSWIIILLELTHFFWCLKLLTFISLLEGSSCNNICCGEFTYYFGKQLGVIINKQVTSYYKV